MIVDKVINNNVISAFDESGQEVVVMGRGVGYKVKNGTPLDENKVEKIFRIENPTVVNQLKELLKHMPLEHMQISNDIIGYAKKKLNLKLNQSIYVTLTDHIDFTIERYSQGIELQNALLWEIKRFYHQEYLLGEYAVELINERLHVHLTEDEAGFIALHFVNAEYNTKISDTFAITAMIQNILKIVKEELQMEFEEHSLHYERFLTHLKFLAQRVYQRELLSDEENELSTMMQTKYPQEYRCSKKIAVYIDKEADIAISEEEIMYLTIHIRRVRMVEDE